MNYSVIPNVYQAAFMEGLLKRRIKENDAMGLIPENEKLKLINSKLRQDIKNSRFLAISESNPFEMEIVNKKNREERKTLTLPKSRHVLTILKNQYGFNEFPTGSIQRNNGNMSVKPTPFFKTNKSEETVINKTGLTNFIYTKGIGNANIIENEDYEIYVKPKKDFKHAYTTTTNKLWEETGGGGHIFNIEK